ncbi:MAG: dephospho-CoA kinase [Lachnospiraceae bacterium]|nr:dephospho-CoA kinase [Lachnospiraceae bacterium]
MKPSESHVVYGLTGGVGAGKSEILRYIGTHYTCRIIQADEVGRELMQKGRSVYRALVREFGEGILAPDGSIDRSAFARQLFSNPDDLKRANKTEHPIIRDSILRRIRRTKCRHIFLEAALLQEGGLIPLCKEVIVVTADPETRIKRLMASRGYTEEKTRTVMAGQLSDEAFLGIADHVIDTGGTLEDTYEKTRQLMAGLEVPVKHDTV